MVLQNITNFKLDKNKRRKNFLSLSLDNLNCNLKDVPLKKSTLRIFLAEIFLFLITSLWDHKLSDNAISKQRHSVFIN